MKVNVLEITLKLRTDRYDPIKIPLGIILLFEKIERKDSGGGRS